MPVMHGLLKAKLPPAAAAVDHTRQKHGTCVTRENLSEILRAPGSTAVCQDKGRQQRQHHLLRHTTGAGQEIPDTLAKVR
jgi:hypothetical protein